MNPEYESLLKHTLGAEEKNKSLHGYRNFYCCGDSFHKSFIKFQEMEKIGLVEMYWSLDKQVCFRATISGARAIGFGNAALIRAGLLARKI